MENSSLRHFTQSSLVQWNIRCWISSIVIVILLSECSYGVPVNWGRNQHSQPQYFLTGTGYREPKNEYQVAFAASPKSFPVKRKTPSPEPTTTETSKEVTPTQIQLSFDRGNLTAVNYAVTGFIRSAENTFRQLLISTQNGLLRMIGQIDLGMDRFQKRLQNSSFELTLAGQKAAATAYEALPPMANQVIQKLGTPPDARSRERLSAQLNGVVNNMRQNRKQFFDGFEEHEHDWHNVFQDRFTQINQYLRVPDLPQRPFGWF